MDATTPWLSGEQQQAWRSHLQATRLLLDAVDRQLQREAGLSHADYEILVRLSEAPDRQLRMKQLADALMFSRSRLSHAVARLERAGWVLREDDLDDGRGTLALLTPDGWDKLVAAAPGHVRAVRELLIDRLSTEQVAQLHGISAAVRDGPASAGPVAPSEAADHPIDPLNADTQGFDTHGVDTQVVGTSGSGPGAGVPGVAGAGRAVHLDGVDLSEVWRTQQLMEAVLEATTEQALIATDLSGRIVVFNAGAERMLSYSAEQALGRDVAALLHDPVELARRAEEAGVPVESVVVARAQGGGADTRHWTFRRRDGSTLTVALSVTVLRHPEGEVEGYLGVAVDVTAQQQREQRLARAAEQAAYRATHDPLTGLPNRAVLLERLEQAVIRHRRSSLVSGVLYLDVDGLKTVNDTHGHAAGDAVLIEVGRRLLAAARDGDLCARLSGDEFVVLLDDVHGQPELDAVTVRIQQHLSTPVQLSPSTALTVRASVGGTLTRPGDTLETVLARADHLMYSHKTGHHTGAVWADQGTTQPGQVKSPTGPLPSRRWER